MIPESEAEIIPTVLIQAALLFAMVSYAAKSARQPSTLRRLKIAQMDGSYAGYPSTYNY